MVSRILISNFFSKRVFGNVKAKLLIFLASFVVFVVYNYMNTFLDHTINQPQCHARHNVTIYHHYTCSKILTLNEIPNYLVPAFSNFKEAPSETKICEIMPIIVNGTFPLTKLNVTEKYLENLAEQRHIKIGGSWKPTSCISQHKVAIVIPYRDRQSQLNVFLAHMHRFLQFQNLNYQIIVVEQTHQRPFNRAKLFNIGFTEAEKMSTFHCYIFHDVDLIPLNTHNIYGCTKLPRHMSANIDVFRFKTPYDWIFGGAVAILKEDFVLVNGFSNEFFGWGGEDDDFFNRVTRNGRSICRFEPEISRYTMLKHKKEPPNKRRYHYLRTGERRYESDGLNSLKYLVRYIEFKPLYTKILTDL